MDRSIGLWPIGTARGYEQALKGFADYLRQHRSGNLRSASEEEARQYLAERSQVVGQKTLDLDRQAIQIHLGQKLLIVCSCKESTLATRSYTLAQVERIPRKSPRKLPRKSSDFLKSSWGK